MRSSFRKSSVSWLASCVCSSRDGCPRQRRRIHLQQMEARRATATVSTGARRHSCPGVGQTHLLSQSGGATTAPTGLPAHSAFPLCRHTHPRGGPRRRRQPHGAPLACRKVLSSKPPVPRADTSYQAGLGEGAIHVKEGNHVGLFGRHRHRRCRRSAVAQGPTRPRGGGRRRRGGGGGGDHGGGRGGDAAAKEGRRGRSGGPRDSAGEAMPQAWQHLNRGATPGKRQQAIHCVSRRAAGHRARHTDATRPAWCLFSHRQNKTCCHTDEWNRVSSCQR